MADSFQRLEREVVACRACPRLVAWRDASAARPPRRFAGQEYWARPVPGFGDPRARILVVGLAPAAHGGNRTGRVFTGDASGDFLVGALHRAGVANQAYSVSRDDGLRLRDCFIAAPVRCAPPANRPTPAEFSRCRPYLVREIRLLKNLSVVVALGALAWKATFEALSEAGLRDPAPRPRFAHAAEDRVGHLRVIGSYHVSQQNTNTGRLTRAMFDEIWRRVLDLLRP